MNGVNKDEIWFEKNRHLKYEKVSEGFAEAAGEDSPSAIIGKTDEDLCWRGSGNDCETSDLKVQKFFNIQTYEWVNTSSGWNELIVGKHSDDRGRVKGNIKIVESIASGLLNEYQRHQTILVPSIRKELCEKDLITIAFIIGAIPKKVAASKMHITENGVYKRMERLMKLFYAKSKHELVIEMNRLGLTSVVYALLTHKLL